MHIETMPYRTLIVLGHPSSGSLCAALADTYAETARQAGAEIRILKLGELQFDPVLWHGYGEAQPLEPDLATAQQHISWAEHLVFVYPIWWGALPSLLKGFIDRTFLPGFAFKYRPDSSWWDRLLTGRSARLIVTMDSPPWYYRWVFRMPGHNQMRKTILEYCGIRPVAVTSFGPVHGSTPETRARWVEQVKTLAKRDQS
jgi:putative NADPH-quinone reductase